jgi:DNA replication licensing factor MCM5
MDRQSVYSARVYDANFGQSDDSRSQLQSQLETFILDFRLDNHFVYRYVLPSRIGIWGWSGADRAHSDQLKENALLKKYYCDVDINDLINFNEELAHRLVTEPAEVIPLVRLYLTSGSPDID